MNRKVIVFFLVFGLLLFSGCLNEGGKGKVSVNVIESDGVSLEGAEILIKTRTSNTIVAEGMTDQEGNYETELTFGDYTIKISKEGYENTYLEDKTLDSDGISISWALSPKTPVSEETIEEILAKANNINSLEFTLINFDGTESQIYQKNEKYRFDTKIKATVNSEEKTYAYSGISDGENKYYSYEEEINPGFTPFVNFDLIGLSKDALNDSELKEVGAEEINGKTTRIIEFTSKSQKIKTWVSEEYGISVKMQVKTSMGNLEMELKNIKVNSVDDSVFDVSTYNPIPQ